MINRETISCRIFINMQEAIMDGESAHGEHIFQLLPCHVGQFTSEERTLLGDLDTSFEMRNDGLLVDRDLFTPRLRGEEVPGGYILVRHAGFTGVREALAEISLRLGRH